ncbi:MAG TPA: HPr kinase/phosphatase C-terminal domain-containing protein [Alphaproteobacteria bacterium]|nr:HPr kinase/phosphatase C-terminal domain-containing protein [Alphaproteobacteria bacterium]
MIQVHGSCVEIDGRGVLLRGASGRGKSDLALRLIDRGARLVADDRVDLNEQAGVLTASAPEPIAGRLEVRGVGIISVAAVAAAPLELVVELVELEDVERLPEPRFSSFLGINIPLIRLVASEASAAAKVRLAVRSLGRGETAAP